MEVGGAEDEGTQELREINREHGKEGRAYT